jgi:hypothetical protein
MYKQPNVDIDDFQYQWIFRRIDGFQTNVYHCLSMFINVYQCIQISTDVYQKFSDVISKHQFNPISFSMIDTLTIGTNVSVSTLYVIHIYPKIRPKSARL